MSTHEPSSLDDGAPAQRPREQGGFASAREQGASDKVRARPDSFFDHYSQATLFWNSQTALERDHIVDAFRFELGKVETPHVRQRMIDNLQNVDAGLAQRVAQGLEMRLQSPSPRREVAAAPIDAAPSVSMFHEPVETARSRKVAIVVADGVDGREVKRLAAALSKQGAVPKIVGAHGGEVPASDDPVRSANAGELEQPRSRLRGVYRFQVIDSMVSGGCLVCGSEARRSVLFPNVRVESGCDIEDAVILPNVEIGRDARLQRVIVDQGTRIPPGLIAGFDPESDRQRFHASPAGITLITADMLGEQR